MMKEDLNDRLDRARAFTNENVARAKAATSKAGERISDMREKAERAADNANHIVSRHPVTAVATAVAVGALAAYLFPRSARSIRKAAPKIMAAAAAARREVTGAAKSGLENAREFTSSVTEQVEHGIEKSGIIDRASEAATRMAAKIRGKKAE